MDELEPGKVYSLKGKEGLYRYLGGDKDSPASWEPVNQQPAQRQAPQRQPGMTGIAAFGADPNYFNALADATRGVLGEMAQGATAMYADEMGIPREEGVPGPVAFAAQTAGAMLPAFLGGPFAARMMAGFPSRVLGGGAAGAGAAAAYASGAAEPGDRGRAAVAAAPFGFAFGAGAPAAAAGATQLGRYGKKLFGFPLREPVNELAHSIGETNLSRVTTGSGALADDLGVQGEVAVRKLGPSLSPDDAGAIERGVLQQRRAASLTELDDAVSSIVAPGTSPEARRRIAQEAYQVHQNAEAPAAAQELVRRIKDSGGSTLVSQNRIGVGSEPLRNKEVQDIILAAKNHPSARVRQFADELREVQSFALKEGNSQWARAMRAESVDDIISKAEAAGSLSRRALPNQLPNTLRRDLERTLSAEEFARFMEAYQRIASNQNRTVGLTDAVRGAYGAAFNLDDTITQELTAAAYLGAGQPGASARTGITAILREAGRPARQVSAREQMRMLLEDDPAVALQALRDVFPAEREAVRGMNRRAGIFSTYLGSRIGGLLGGR